LENDSDDEEDNFVVSSKSAPSKPASKKPVAKVTAAPTVDLTVSVLEKLSITPPTLAVVENMTMAPAAAAKSVVPKKAAPVAKKVPPAKKEPAKKKTYAKKATKKYDSSDEDEDSDNFMGNDGSDSEVEMISAPVPARERSGRAAAKKVTYVIDDSDEDESNEESD
jgi:UV DNA damage endonuclease